MFYPTINTFMQILTVRYSIRTHALQIKNICSQNKIIFLEKSPELKKFSRKILENSQKLKKNYCISIQKVKNWPL